MKNQDRKVIVLNVWAGLFTDNCSEYDVQDLYAHYTAFARLLRRFEAVVPYREFEAFTRENAPMGLHDGEDTEALIESLAKRYYGPVHAGL